MINVIYINPEFSPLEMKLKVPEFWQANNKTNLKKLFTELLKILRVETDQGQEIIKQIDSSFEETSKVLREQWAKSSRDFQNLYTCGAEKENKRLFAYVQRDKRAYDRFISKKEVWESLKDKYL